MKKIIEENAKFEKEAPYNFCDRWCERCTHKKQMRCKLYQDEFERKITCIAHSRDEDYPEVTEAILEKQYQEIDEKLEETARRLNIDLDNIDIDESDLDEEQRIEFEDLPKEIQEHIKFVENHPLRGAVEQYRKRTHEFLKATFYEKNIKPELKYHFETISWYHTLLSAKLQRALAGFHEPVYEGDFALYDAVAQFAICKKAINESIKALTRLKLYYSDYKNLILELLALLHNILSRIKAMEESI